MATANPNVLAVTRKFATRNLDISGLLRRLDRALVEVTKSQSTSINTTLPFDMTRLSSYVDSAKRYRTFMTGEPFMDCPETTPLLVEVQCYGQITPMDNDSIWDIAQIIDTTMVELSRAQSANISNGFPVPQDGIRFDAYMARIEKLMSVYMAPSEPLDYPESSPRFATTGDGNNAENNVMVSP